MNNAHLASAPAPYADAATLDLDAMADDEASEITPLINAQGRRDDGDGDVPLLAGRPGGGRSRATSLLSAVTIPQAHKPETIVYLFYAAVFLAAGAGGLWAIPATRMLEDIICRQHYDLLERVEPIDESLCKADPIQARLAALFAGYNTLEAVTSCLVAFPWGIVADRIGRKYVLGIALVGFTLDMAWFNLVCGFWRVLPLELVWVAGLFILIGGGNSMVNASMMSILTDVLPESERAAVFMRVHLLSMIGNLCGPAVSVRVMEYTGPWLVMWISTAIMASIILFVQFIPETKPREPVAVAAHLPLATEDVESLKEVSFLARLRQGLSELSASVQVLRSPSLLLLFVAAMSAVPVTFATMQFMAQYASKRYSVSLLQSGNLLSFYGLANMAVILFLLPLIMRLIRADATPKPFRQDDDRNRDLLVARASIMFFVLGSVLLAFAPSLVLFMVGLGVLAMGAGFGSLVRSLAALYIDPQHRTQLYSLYMIGETIGIAYANPMLAGLFALGMKLGGVLLGLPYLGVACTTTLALVLMVFVRLPRRALDEGHESGDEGEESSSD